MGFPTKVQLIKRKASEQWYINFPSAVAQAMEFSRGETVEWVVEDKSLLALRRLDPPPAALKKRRHRTPPATRPTLATMPTRLRPTPRRPTRPSPLPQLLALSRTPYRYRSADHCRLAV